MRSAVPLLLITALTGCGGEDWSDAPATATGPVAHGAVSAKSTCSNPKLITVGPTNNRDYKTIAEAATFTPTCATVEIDAATYAGDVAIWSQNDLTIRGVGSYRPVLDAARKSAEDKGIFVIKGSNVVVENLDFRNAKASRGNGAGIRMEGQHLTVRNTVFKSNQTGILTFSDAASESAVLKVYDSQFINNGFKSSNGQAHSIYAGRIAHFVIQGSYLTGTEVGHLVKSRARQTELLYNRITGEAGTNSYEVNLPNGGMAYLIGNLVEQGANSKNATVIAYGEEGLYWQTNRLYVSYNTLVNRLSGACAWINAPSAEVVKIVDTITLGSCGSNLPANTLLAGGNFSAQNTDFVDPTKYDYRLQPNSALVGNAVDAGFDEPGNTYALTSTQEYSHAPSSRSVPLASVSSNPGAFQSMP